MDHSLVVSLVLDVVKDYLRTSGAREGRVPPDEVSESTLLFGRDGTLDSAGLINVVMEIETRLRDAHNVDVLLADERAFGQRSSPFLSVSSLADHAHACLKDAQPS